MLALLLFATPAFAFDEPNNQPEQHQGAVASTCLTCHRVDSSQNQCSLCHPSHGSLADTAQKGPHGLYTATTDRCDACHDVHASGGSKLLASATVTGSCYTCHDGTGGKGVYGAIAARGLTAGGQHQIDITSVVPGGDASTGGSSTVAFNGLNGKLGCDDCHSPHDSSTVASFTGDRRRVTFTYAGIVKTSHLLRRSPGGTTMTVNAYGSDWCIACHRGRASMTSVNNHPVDSTATTATPFTYGSLAVLTSDNPVSTTTTGALGQTNRGYLMPFPRTAQQSGHGPICQQCHEDSRFVGVLSADGLTADPATFSLTTTDGAGVSDDPRFQDFPHETVNARMTVETYDDLCLNCHPVGGLP